MNGAVGSHRFRSTAAASLETDTGDGGNVDIGESYSVDAKIQAVRAEIQSVRIEMFVMEKRMVIWSAGIAVAIAAFALLVATLVS